MKSSFADVLNRLVIAINQPTRRVIWRVDLNQE